MAILRNHIAARWDLDLAFKAAGLGTPFPRGITFGDVDAETEINGQYLVMEGKRAGEEPSAGQTYTMDARVRDGRTCIVVYGDPPTGIVAMRVWGGDKRPITLQQFWAFIHAWAEWAETSQRPGSRINGFMGRWRAPLPVLPLVEAQCEALDEEGGRCVKPGGHEGPTHESHGYVWPRRAA